MVKRLPHTAVISWRGVGTKNASGVYTQGAEETVTVSCTAQPNNSGKFIIGASGDQTTYTWTLFADSFTEAASIPDSAIVTIFDKEYKLLRLFHYQKHVEIKI